MKAQSKEVSGQFPAVVLAKANPHSGLELRLEITELLGSRVALIEIRGDEFKVQSSGGESKKRNVNSWGGIPLEWASQMFLDRVPCPNVQEFSSLTWVWKGDDEVHGKSKDGETIWIYQFREWNQKPWITQVSWQKSPNVSLKVRREDPDLNEGWAKRWEALSESGQVKVRWKDRTSN